MWIIIVKVTGEFYWGKVFKCVTHTNGLVQGGNNSNALVTAVQSCAKLPITDIQHDIHLFTYHINPLCTSPIHIRDLNILTSFKMADLEISGNIEEYRKICIHYIDVIMSTMASQITSLTIVNSTFYSGADQRKHQSSASLAFVWVIHRGPLNSPHKWPVTRKMFPFDDVIMNKRLYPRSRDVPSALLRLKSPETRVFDSLFKITIDNNQFPHYWSSVRGTHKIVEKWW